MVSNKMFPTIEGDQVSLSGTRVREMLVKGERPLQEFTRPEIAVGHALRESNVWSNQTSCWIDISS